MATDDKIRVLVVDDNHSICKLVSGFVSDLAFEVVPAVDPRQALEYATQMTFHVAIVDLHMPGMDGIELMKSLLEHHPDMAVIVMSGDHSPEPMVDAIDGGAFDFLWKPLNFSRLEQALNAARHSLLKQV